MVGDFALNVGRDIIAEVFALLEKTSSDAHYEPGERNIFVSHW